MSNIGHKVKDTYFLYIGGQASRVKEQFDRIVRSDIEEDNFLKDKSYELSVDQESTFSLERLGGLLSEDSKVVMVVSTQSDKDVLLQVIIKLKNVGGQGISTFVHYIEDAGTSVSSKIANVKNYSLLDSCECVKGVMVHQTQTLDVIAKSMIGENKTTNCDLHDTVVARIMFSTLVSDKVVTLPTKRLKYMEAYSFSNDTFDKAVFTPVKVWSTNLSYYGDVVPIQYSDKLKGIMKSRTGESPVQYTNIGDKFNKNGLDIYNFHILSFIGPDTYERISSMIEEGIDYDNVNVAQLKQTLNISKTVSEDTTFNTAMIDRFEQIQQKLNDEAVKVTTDLNKVKEVIDTKSGELDGKIKEIMDSMTQAKEEIEQALDDTKVETPDYITIGEKLMELGNDINDLIEERKDVRAKIRSEEEKLEIKVVDITTVESEIEKIQDDLDPNELLPIELNVLTKRRDTLLQEKDTLEVSIKGLNDRRKAIKQEIVSKREEIELIHQTKDLPIITTPIESWEVTKHTDSISESIEMYYQYTEKVNEYNSLAGLSVGFGLDSYPLVVNEFHILVNEAIDFYKDLINLFDTYVSTQGDRVEQYKEGIVDLHGVYTNGVISGNVMVCDISTMQDQQKTTYVPNHVGGHIVV